MFSFRNLLRGSVFFAFSAGAIIAQDAVSPGAGVPAATLKLNARTVVVDVVVTDKDGRAVPGLRKDDFQVTENGKPQTIDYFEPHFAAASAAPPAAPPLPPNTFTNVPATAPNEAVNVLLMDALNTQIADQMYVRKEMFSYLASIPPGIRVGVFVLGEKLRIIQGFTQDSAILRASIARLAANPNSSALLSSPSESDAQANLVNIIADQPQGSGLQSAMALQDFLGQEASFEYNQRILTTLDSLQQIARYLAGVPGRKNLIWFAGSIPICLPVGPAPCPYEEKVEETFHMLADARVAVYPIGATGLETNALYDAGVPQLQVTNYQSLIASQKGSLKNEFESRSNLKYMRDWFAEETGGKAIPDTNDLKGALADDIEDGSRYYTLAYTPKNRKEVGKERKIEIKTASGSYKLSYRRGYLEETPKQIRAAEATPAKDPLRPLMDRGMPNFTELRYRVKVEPAAIQPPAGAPRAGDNTALTAPCTRYSVNFSLAADGLTLVPGPDGVRRQIIEVALVVYSQEGKPLNWETRPVRLTSRPEPTQFGQTSGIPFQFHFDFDAPPGDVYLRTGIYATSSNRAGTLEIPLSSITVASK
ncbi:MAG: VWA domain-containing protein [Terracidiphilus sp.]